MPDAASDGPDSRGAVLAVVAALGLVAAGAAAPAVAGETPLSGLDNPTTPEDLPRALSQFDFVRDLFENQQQDQPLQIPGGETFGALDPGESTDVGGAVSQQAQQEASAPHFVAESASPQYWRTAAYVDYTGDGWEDATVNSVQPSRRVDSREQTRHRVTLRQPASALPTPWRPVDLTHKCDDAESCEVLFSLTDTAGIRAEPALSAGEQYTVVSLDGVSRPSLLRDVRVEGSIAPAEYTDADTTDRVTELAARITADANNRYGAAASIESYLESSKTYSLTDVPEPGDQITDQFLFEQDAGYCEYFATAMTTMLRTQDIPARYVTGYTPGERVGSDQYLVRGADAHAWVEVFFENYGWVRFDPTPAAPRQAADDRLAAGSPSYQILTNQSLIPGDEVSVSVSSAGTPADGVRVSVNGEFVGVTDDAGEVAFTVPYAETVNVSVAPSVNGSDQPLAGDGNASGFGVASLAQDDGNSTSESFDVATNVQFAFPEDPEPGDTTTASVTIAGRPFADAAVSVAGEPQGRTDGDGEVMVTIPEDASGVVDLTASRDDLDVTVTYPLDDLQVAVNPDLFVPLPTTGATATVTSGGEPVAGALVRLNGERVGTTGADGTVSLTIPLARLPAVAAAASGKAATTYVGFVLPTLAAAVLAAAGALAGLGLAARRRGVTVEQVAVAVRYFAREVASAVVEAISGVADAVDDLAAEFRAAADEGWREALAFLARLPGRARLPDVRAWAAGVVRAARAAAAAGRNGGDDSAGGRLQSLWRQFVAVVGVDRWRTKTPGEVARTAVDRGLPRQPVYALTDAFRDAAYGDRDTDSRLERAQSALDVLRSDDEEEER
jgi:transglutaminase-like putative cysteine protease